MNLSGEIIIDVDIVNGLKKEFQKMKITYIISPEHNKRHTEIKKR